MATVRGTVSWGIQPFNWSNSNAAGAFWQNRYNFMKSVNDPLKYQVQWFVAGLTEGVEPSAGNYTSAGAGDLVSVIFTVQVRDGLGLDWREIGVIKKSRDIASRHIVTQNPANGHRFTVDVSALVADELSYSLCPINKGTWQTNIMGFNQYGGMNGGLVNADNVLGNSGAAGSSVSYFNQSPNGTMTHLRVVATYEIVDLDGSIVSASGSKTSTTISVINSVNQFEEDTVYYEKEFLQEDSILDAQIGIGMMIIMRCLTISLLEWMNRQSFYNGMLVRLKILLILQNIIIIVRYMEGLLQQMVVQKMYLFWLTLTLY